MTDLLFVHTDDKLTDLCSTKLSQYFQVHRAIDGLSAVRKVRRHKPKIVISEYDLPLLSGRALVKFVRSYPPTTSSVFIFFSKQEFVPEALNLGANAWLATTSSSPQLLIDHVLHYV
ncbi:MAG: response regulator [Candidatus Doudnabacteria bacterium]|nr:response regulator [Candidatus Doudnabacteria bacterium]